MNPKANLKMISGGQGTSSQDLMKWIVVFLLLIVGIVANTYFSSVAWAIRAACGLVLIAAIFLIASRTNNGQVFWRFVQASRAELRKVAWPTRQETIQTTLVVVGMVVLAALVLWGIDTFFFWLVGWLTGQRG